MLSLYEILKASKTGIAPDMWTALAGANFGGAGSGAETKEITGIPPLSIRSNGTMLLDYLISGNMSQTGTPTSSDPIQPQETGERTGNLADLYGVNKTSINLTFRTVDNMKIVIDGKKSNGSNIVSIKTPNISIPAGTYTAKIKMVDGHIENMPETAYGVFFGINQNTYSQRTTPGVLNIGDVGTRTFTLSEDTVISSFDIAPGYANSTNGPIFNNATFECWFYAGSDDKAYEPYGIIIPISSGGNNLFDEIYPGLEQEQAVKYKPIYVGNGNFTLSTDYPLVQAGTADLFLLPGKVSSGASTVANGVYFGQSRTCSSVGGYVTIGYRKYSATHPLLSDYHTMLNRGSTALPYEPYVQLTLSNIYLGEVQTTRRIRKLVFDGTETGWRKGSTFFFNQELNPDYLRVRDSITCMCSHYQTYQQVGSGSNVPEGYCSLYYAPEVQRFYIKDSNFATLEDFTAYLSAQYANGTPVTIWYVLAEPTTGTVNEPLRKIGDHADTISYEQAGVQIPTNRGNTVIDVLTELKPSEMYIKYKG